MMKSLMGLVRRNITMYLRNRASVAFSFLSMLIILALNTIFLGGINEEYLAKFMPASRVQVAHVTGSWLMAGIIVVNAVMVTLSVLGIMVEDEEKHKLAAFLVAPIIRVTLVLSYIMAACMTSFVFCLITLGISQIYLYMTCKVFLSMVALFKIIGLIAANIFSIVTLFICMAVFIRSTSAYGAFTTTIGTLIGFIAGIYLPIGSLPDYVQKVLKAFPVLYGTAAVREVYTEAALLEIFKGAPEEVINGYKVFMGIRIEWGDRGVSLFMCLLLLVGSGILFTIIAIGLLSKKKTSDR